MNYKKKSWIWYLTFPFAHNNYTTIWDTVYCPHDRKPSVDIMAHEAIHSRQQKEWGKLAVPVWIWLYLVGFPLGLPFFFNPWRKKWEFEAYTKGSLFSEKYTLSILRSYRYGWLI
jgi:hypothetical protein